MIYLINNNNNKIIGKIDNYENYFLKKKIPYKKLPDLDSHMYEIKNEDINNKD